jgi:hypothetical protein
MAGKAEQAHIRRRSKSSVEEYPRLPYEKLEWAESWNIFGSVGIVRVLVL